MIVREWVAMVVVRGGWGLGGWERQIRESMIGRTFTFKIKSWAVFAIFNTPINVSSMWNTRITNKTHFYQK
jgi:hypothetical protein